MEKGEIVCTRLDYFRGEKFPEAANRGGSRLFNSIVRLHFQPRLSHTVADRTAICVREFPLSPSLSYPSRPFLAFCGTRAKWGKAETATGEEKRGRVARATCRIGG